MPNRIDNLDQLKGRVAALFERDDIKFHEFRTHQLLFQVDGSPKAVFAALKRKTDVALWSVMDNVLWTYQDEASNVVIGLSNGGSGVVLVSASIASLHQEYLAELLRQSCALPVTAPDATGTPPEK